MAPSRRVAPKIAPSCVAWLGCRSATTGATRLVWHNFGQQRERRGDCEHALNTAFPGYGWQRQAPANGGQAQQQSDGNADNRGLQARDPERAGADIQDPAEDGGNGVDL